MRRTSLLTIAALGLAACADQPTMSDPSEPAPAPLLAAAGDAQVPDRFIVVFRSSVADPDRLTDDLIRAYGGQVSQRYRTALKGFAATLPAPALEAIRRNPNVEFVEADGLAYAIGSQANPPSWGLDRIDQAALPLNLTYTYNNDGAGVRAYILDTGIRYTHVQFGGRAVTGRDFVSNDDVSEDCHGHGTHVAGTVGGNTTGVAKGVTLVGVRVLGCNGSGSWSGIIGAIDWVTAQQASWPSHRFVGNMSLGGGLVSSLNTAINNSVALGVVWAVAAGNDYSVDACQRSPASASEALTVGATSNNDARASFSNIGACLDLFAPGVSIYSSTNNGDATYGSWSGTSMATPHVAGVAALYRTAFPSATAAQTNSAINGGATVGVVGNAGTGSPNRLLYSLVDGGTPPPAPEEPEEPVVETVRVADLSGASLANGKKNWKAQVTIRVSTTAGVNKAGATVTGTWSSGGTTSCTTGSAGTCTVTSGAVSRTGVPSITWSVSNITGTGMTYGAASNIESSIVLTRP